MHVTYDIIVRTSALYCTFSSIMLGLEGNCQADLNHGTDLEKFI